MPVLTSMTSSVPRNAPLSLYVLLPGVPSVERMVISPSKRSLLVSPIITISDSTKLISASPLPVSVIVPVEFWSLLSSRCVALIVAISEVATSMLLPCDPNSIFVLSSTLTLISLVPPSTTVPSVVKLPVLITPLFAAPEIETVVS